MGMPINSYTALSALTKNHSSSFYNRLITPFLSKFSLFAFIIYDPDASPEFRKHLEHNFEILDHSTGDRLLFFALVDSPCSWKNKEKYKKISFRDSEYLLNPKSAIDSTNKSLTANALAHSLNIPTDALPCLVVTDNFKSQSFEWFQTSEQHINDQLNYLGLIATHGSSIPLSDRDRCHLSAKIKFGEEFTCQTINTSMAEALSDVLSLIIAGHGRHEGKEQAQTVLKRLYENLSLIRQQLPEGDIEDSEHLHTISELSLQIAEFIALLNQKSFQKIHKKRTASPILEIDPKNLEPESVQMLKTATLIYDLYQYPPDWVDIYELDLSPLVITLAKIFENELNHSLVQWIRKKLGIDMPAFFTKHQPNKNAVQHIREGYEIDFNRHTRAGEWIPPGLGQSQNAYKEILKTTISPISTPQNNSFLIYWKEIGKTRNNAAHMQTTSFEDASRVTELLQQFNSELDIFSELHQLKKRLCREPSGQTDFFS
jgi:hypothetical protein